MAPDQADDRLLLKRTQPSTPRMPRRRNERSDTNDPPAGTDAAVVDNLLEGVQMCRFTDWTGDNTSAIADHLVMKTYDDIYKLVGELMGQGTTWDEDAFNAWAERGKATKVRARAPFVRRFSTVQISIPPEIACNHDQTTCFA